MEKSPTQVTPESNPQAGAPFDFSKYTQPETVEAPSETPADVPFDFSEYTKTETPGQVVVHADEQLPDSVFNFSEYRDGQSASKAFEEVSQEISADAQLTKRWDFSDENIAAGGPTLRDATPTEIYEQGRADQQAEQAQRKNKFGSGIVSKLFRRG